MLESYFTLLTKRIIDEAIIPQNPEALREIVVIYVAIAVLFSIGVFGFIYLAGILGHRVQYDLRQKLFNHLQDLSFSYFDRTPVGWIMSRLTSDTERIAELVTWGLLDTAWAVMNVTTGVIFMMIINWRLALIVVALVPVLVVLSIWFKQKIIVQFRAGAQDQLKDHRCVQREYHRCSRGQGTAARTKESRRVWRTHG